MFSAVIDLLFGLLPVQKILSVIETGKFTIEDLAMVFASNFAPSFSFKFLSISVHISGSTEPITLIWVSLFLFQTKEPRLFNNRDHAVTS